MDFRDKKGQIRFAAKLVSSVLEVKAMIDNGTFPAEYFRGKPLCMKQYEQVFSSCRIPGLEMDTLEYYTHKHITVVHNCQFFALDVYNNDGTLLTVDQLCVQLERICNSSLQTNMEPVGILTTEHRDSWAQTYIKLIKDKTNKDSLSAIQSSIFVVCLDGATPTVSDEMYHSSAFLQILHGGGSQLFSGNRWFDKGFQVIIGEDGTYGLTGSNTTADVTVGATICAYVGACMKKLHVMQSPVEPLPQPQKLHFNLTPEIKKDIEEAKQHIDRLAQDLEMKTVMFDHFGKNAIKALKMNPNAFMQMALQLAFYRTFHQIQPMLDVITLRMFRLGRASFININTPASVAFVKVFDDPETQKSEKFDLLEKAIKAHEHYTDMALRGQDAFCHLQGLKMQALEEKISVPDIFTDTSFQKAFDYKVVASQIVHSSGCVLCFGPEGPGQYVLIHGIMSNHIEFVVASLETCKEYNAAHMAHALQDALCDIRNLLEQTTRAKIVKDNA